MLVPNTPVTCTPTNAASLTKRQRGASMVEYTLLVALIAVVAIVSLRELGNTTANQFVKIVTELGGEMPTP